MSKYRLGSEIAQREHPCLYLYVKINPNNDFIIVGVAVYSGTSNYTKQRKDNLTSPVEGIAEFTKVGLSVSGFFFWFFCLPSLIRVRGKKME